jgi:hypothetical protein
MRGWYIIEGEMLVPSALSIIIGSQSMIYETRASRVEEARLQMRDSSGVIAEIELKKEGSQWRASVSAQKNGQTLIGKDSRFAPSRYSQVLDGRYSLPFKTPDGRLRAFRDSVGKVIRFAWGFEQEVAGEKTKGWVELAPLPDPFGQEVKVEGVGNNLTTTPIPSQDKDDRATGFRVTKRPFHWSGAFGDALVVTFDNAFAWQQKDLKLAFWSEAAWTPFWVMSPKAMQGFEFVETWGGGAQGCFEPMSDRVNRWARAEVVEDTEVRKIIRWRYALVNPDYVPWGAALGSKQPPEVEEEWTVTPDGTVFRLQRFWPSLDTAEAQHSLGIQLAEADVVFASNVLPEDVLPREALTAFGSDGKRVQATYPRKGRNQTTKVGDWSRFGYAVHYADQLLPDPFIGFADPGLDSSLDWPDTWHEQQFWRFSHFPFNHEPFANETNSQHEGRGLITHTCLAYVGDARRRDWKNEYLVDGRGRKYREWSSLIGMEPKGSLDAMDQRLKQWQEGGRWEKLIRGAKGRWNPGRGELVLDKVSGSVILGDGSGRRPLISLPKESLIKEVSLAGRRLAKGKEWRTAMAGGRTLIWFSPKLGRGDVRLLASSRS